MSTTDTERPCDRYCTRECTLCRGRADLRELRAAAVSAIRDTERDERLRGILVCSTCDGVGLVGSTPMNSGECPACLDLDRRLLAAGVQEEFGLLLAEVARLDAVVTAVRDLADLWEHGATRWENPLPVPDEVAQLRAALDGGAA